MMTPQEEKDIRVVLTSAQLTYRRWYAHDGVTEAYLEEVENGAVAIIGKMLDERDTEIARLKAQLDSIRVARDEAQQVLSMLNADPAVATFQIAAHFQVMGNKVGRILQDGQS